MAAIPFVFNAIAASGVGPESGAKAYTYVKDTATPLAVYTDTGLTTPASNPVVANSLGYMVFYINSTLNYTITIKTSNDATTLLQVTYTASGSVIAVTGGTVPNYNSLVSAIDAQLNFQPIDDDLTAYAGLTGTGFVKRTGSGTASTVSETGTGVVVLQNAPSITGGQKTTGMVRAEGGDAFPAGVTGAGAEVFYDTGTSQAVLQGWNRTSSAYVPVEIRGSTLTIEPAIIDTVDISPTANTYDRALNLVQTGPTSGSTAGPKALNNIDIVVRSTLTGTGLPGDPTSATVQGFNVSMNAGGTNFSAISAMAGSFGLVQTVADTSTGDKNGLSSGVSIAASTLGYAYGGSAGATVTATGSVPGLFGHEVNMFIYTGGTCPIRIGYHSMSWGQERASAVDAAFGVAIPGGGLGTTWGNAFVLSDGNGATPFPLHSTASVVKSFVAGTITNGLKLDNITFTGDLLHFPNFRVTAAGVVTGSTYNGATIDENAWTSYTPIATSSGGSITAYTAVGKWRRLFGRTIVMAARVTLTTIGTASGSLIITLPVNATNAIPMGTLHGREVATNGGGLAGTIQSATTVNCFFSDSTSVFLAGNGTIVDVSITYEAAS